MDCDSWFELEERGLQFPCVGEAGFGIADEGFVDDCGEVFSSPGMRSRMGTGFSLRMMSMGSRLGSKR